MPIQYASQGTLSVLAMFGLIRSYLRSLANGADDEEALLTPAIVVIDEADAHLHPAWQQKVPSLLRQFFPMTQFIVSAHSPLFVAGCWRGEVAVLRRADGTPSEHGFRIDQLDRDFVGASSTELYNQIFEIEELDDTYLEYATKASLRPKLSGRINELSVQREVKRLSDDEETELRDLSEESRRIQRATDVMRQRSVDDKDLRIAELESELARMTPPEKEEVDQAPV
jgi:predicted ATP-binding protein involved in virulence